MKRTRRFVKCQLAAASLLALATLTCMGAGQEINEVHIKYARGKPDTILSGIDVCHTPMATVFKKFGKPDLANHPKNRTTEYVWHRDGTKLLVAGPPSADSDVPPIVEVWGERPADGIGRTGRGLALGADLKDIRRIYGQHFPVLAYRGAHWVSVLWKGQGNAGLDFRLGGNGRVDHIEIQAGDCNPP